MNLKKLSHAWWVSLTGSLKMGLFSEQPMVFRPIQCVWNISTMDMSNITN